FALPPPTGCSHKLTCVPSCPPTSNDLPFGIQIARKIFRSMPRVTSFPSPPAAGATKISFSFARSPSRGYQYASCDPSGEKSPKPSILWCPVSLRIAPLSTSSTCTVRRSLSPECGSSCRVNVRSFPSLDQESGEAGELGGRVFGRLHAPDVRRRALPPSTGTS